MSLSGKTFTNCLQSTSLTYQVVTENRLCGEIFCPPLYLLVQKKYFGLNFLKPLHSSSSNEKSNLRQIFLKQKVLSKRKPERTLSYRIFGFLFIFSSFCKKYRQIRNGRNALQLVRFLTITSSGGSISAKPKAPPTSVQSTPTSAIFRIACMTRNLAFLRTFDGSNRKKKLRQILVISKNLPKNIAAITWFIKE